MLKHNTEFFYYSHENLSWLAFLLPNGLEQTHWAMAAFTTMPTFFEINAPLLYVDSLLSAMHPAGFAPSGQLFSWMSSGFQIIPRLFYQRLSNILWTVQSTSPE